MSWRGLNMISADIDVKSKLLSLVPFSRPINMRPFRLVSLNMVAMLDASTFAFGSPAVSGEETALPEDPAAQHGATNRNASALSPEATMSTEGKDTFTEERP